MSTAALAWESPNRTRGWPARTNGPSRIRISWTTPPARQPPALRWASTRAVLGGRAINLAVGMALNSVYLLPAVASYGIFGGAATLLGLANRLSWAESLVLAFLPPLILIPAWCLWWGNRQQRWVTGEFRTALTSRNASPSASA